MTPQTDPRLEGRGSILRGARCKLKCEFSSTLYNNEIFFALGN